MLSNLTEINSHREGTWVLMYTFSSARVKHPGYSSSLCIAPPGHRFFASTLLLALLLQVPGVGVQKVQNKSKI